MVAVKNRSTKKPAISTVYKHEGTDVVVKLGYYDNGRIAIQLREKPQGFPYCRATVNLSFAPCPEGYTYIKNYSENTGIDHWLMQNGIISGPVQYASDENGHYVPLVKVLIA